MLHDTIVTVSTTIPLHAAQTLCNSNNRRTNNVTTKVGDKQTTLQSINVFLSQNESLLSRTSITRS